MASSLRLYATSALLLSGCYLSHESGDLLDAGVVDLGDSPTARLSHAHDVNGDGYADVVVGSYNPARVYVFHGGPAGLATRPAESIHLPSGYPSYLVWATFVGDLDADGYADVAIDLVDHGVQRIELRRGGRGGLSTSASATLVPRDGFPADAWSPSAQSFTPGDVDGDDIDDLVVSDVYADPRTGTISYAASLFLGRPGALPTVASRVMTFTDATIAPRAQVVWLAALGDIDADGLHDVALVHQEALERTFVVRVLRGEPDGDWMPTELRVPDTQLLQGVGDVDADGYDDVLVGLETLHRGSATGLGPATAVALEHTGPWLGWQAPAGDLDGDGHADLAAVDAIDMHTDANVNIYRGAASGFESTPAFTLHAPYDSPATTTGSGALFIAAAGDLDRDGYTDLVAGAAQLNIVYVARGGPALTGWAATIVDPEPSAAGPGINRYFGATVD